MLNFTLTSAAKRSRAMLVRVAVQMLPQSENTRSTGAEEAGTFKIWMAIILREVSGWAF